MKYKKYILPALSVLILVLAVIIPNMVNSRVFFTTDIENLLSPPDNRHIFGTDGLGRDMKWRIMRAINNGICTGMTGSLISVIIGLMIYLVFRKYSWRIINIWISFPFNMFILLLIILFSDFTNFYMISGIVFSINIVIFLKSVDFRMSQSNRLYIFLTMFFHIAGLIILAEVTLGYLGFTFQQPEASFGNIFSQARENILDAWWLLIIPGVFLAMLNGLFFYLESFFRRRITNLREKYF